MIKLLREPLTPLIVFAAVLSVCLTAYFLSRQDMSLLFETIVGFCTSVLFVYWILADARRQHVDTCYDFGFLCAVFFPLSIPWHCFRSRGLRGVLTLMLLTAIWISPYLIACITWAIVSGG